MNGKAGRSPADFRVLANIGGLLENYFSSVKRKTDSNYSVELVIKDRDIPIGKIKANSTMVQILEIGGV